jgi:hypothetical protein
MIRNILFFCAIVLLLAAAPVRAVNFDHATHQAMEGGPGCADCHKDGAESIQPDVKVCLECHEQKFFDQVVFPGLKTHGPVWALNHRHEAKSKTVDCGVCHQQAFCLDCHKAGFADEMGKFSNNMINVHTSDFHVTHPIAARTDPQLCTKCHEPKYCSKCHEDFAPADLAIQSHRRGWSDMSVGAATHADFPESQCQTCHSNSVFPTHEWSNQHAREARKNLVTCQACHPDGDVCLKCHSAVSGLKVNPHPSGWDKFGDRLKEASGGKTCRRCH